MEKDQDRERKTKVEKIYNRRMEDGKRAEKGRTQKERVVMEAVPAKTTGTDISRAPTPADLLQIAVSNNADMDKLEKLMDLQIRWEEREAKKAYTKAMAAFKANPPEIIKDKRVEFKQTKYSHATLAKAAQAVSGELSKHGLSHSWNTGQDNGNVSVTCTVTHLLGHSESVTLSAAPDNSGSKNGIQAIGSTVTYLQRYTLFAITGLAAADQDDDGVSSETVEYIDEGQLSTLLDMINDTEADEARFCRHFGVKSVDQLPANKYRAAINALNAKKKHGSDK